MKIRELIEQLSKCDWDSEVEIEGALSNTGYAIDGITEDHGCVRLISYHVIDMDSDRLGASL